MGKKQRPAVTEIEDATTEHELPVSEAPTMVRCKVTGYDNLVLEGKTYPKGAIVDVPAQSFPGLKQGLTPVEDTTTLS